MPDQREIIYQSLTQSNADTSINELIQPVFYNSPQLVLDQHTCILAYLHTCAFMHILKFIFKINILQVNFEYE